MRLPLTWQTLNIEGGDGKDKKEETAAESETKVNKNAAGEDVDALVKTNYDGKRYWCTLCKIVCLKTKVRHND